MRLVTGLGNRRPCAGGSLPSSVGWAPDGDKGRAPSAVVFPDNLAALGVCRSLGRRGVPVTVLASDRTAPGQYSRYARRVSCPPREPLAAFVAFMTALAHEEGERPVLYLTDDASIVMLEPYRKQLEASYRLTIPPSPVLHDVMYKDRLYRLLQDVVPVPRTRVLTDNVSLDAAAAAVGFPAIVKPVVRALPPEAGRARLPFEKAFAGKAVRAHDRRQLSEACEAARALGFTVLVQEDIAGPVSELYGVALYATRDDVVATFTSQKLGQTPADFGDGLIVRAARAPEVVRLAIRAARHLSFQGMADIEFKWDARESTYKLLDWNPRPWLWINLPGACGVDLPWAAYLDAVGQALDPAEFVQRDWDTRWVSARGLVVCAVHALAGRPAGGALTTVLRGARGRRIGPLWSREDVLYRMFVNPVYWREMLAYASHELRQLRAVPEVF